MLTSTSSPVAPAVYSLDRRHVGPDLARRISGRPEVEPLRRLVKGKGSLEDVEASLDFCAAELRAICYEDWEGARE